VDQKFNGDIHDWPSWGRVYQSMEIWEPLVRGIFKKENLPCGNLGRLTPGTNAVFRVDGHVIKIYAPKESGYDGTEARTELSAMKRALSGGVSCPKIVACGEVRDRYNFDYMIMEFIEGREFDEAARLFSNDEKSEFARRLRKTTDIMNKPGEPINDRDVIHDRSRHWRWEKYPERFKRERSEYLSTHNFGEKVFVHGDLCGDNILITGGGGINIIDFADAVMAPVAYEQALVASELFRFEKTFLRGYFGEYERNELTDLCFNGLLIHDFGGDIVKQRVANPKEISCLSDLRNKLSGLL